MLTGCGAASAYRGADRARPRRVAATVSGRPVRGSDGVGGGGGGGRGVFWGGRAGPPRATAIGGQAGLSGRDPGPAGGQEFADLALGTHLSRLGRAPRRRGALSVPVTPGPPPP